MNRVRRVRRELTLLAGVVALGVVVAAAVQPLASAQTGESVAAAAPKALVKVPPVLETGPEFDDEEGGNANADDPAIWIHPDDPDDSLVIGTLKDAGLAVFNLAGKQIQRIAAPAAPAPDDAPGRFNNVDVLTDVELGGKEMDLAVVTDRGRDQLRVYSIDPKKAAAGRNPLTDVTDPAAPFVFSKDQAEVNTQATAYGISLFQDQDDRPMAMVSRELTTTLATVELVAKGGKVGYRVVRRADLPKTFELPDGTTFTPCAEADDGDPFSEGIFVDAEEGVAYVAQELVGLWRMDADLANFKPELIDRTKEFGVPATFNAETDECEPTGPDPGFGGKNLSADIEGTTVFDAGDGTGYLLVSSQGNNTIAVYEREGDNAFLGSFQISSGQGDVDSVEETDGMTVTNVPLGRFKEGLLVLQDGANTPEVEGGEEGEPRENTNFKFVSWGEVAKAFDPPLDTNPED